MLHRRQHHLKLFGAILGSLVLSGLILTQKRVTASPQQTPTAQATNALECGDEPIAQGEAGATMVNIQSGPRPGATDPMAVPAGRLDMFPDQGLAAFSPLGVELTTEFYKTYAGTNLSLDNQTGLQSSPWDPQGFGPTPIFATAGRILMPDKDSLVWANRVGNPNAPGSAVAVSFRLGLSTTLPDPLLQRQQDATDFIAVAQGDLDRAVGQDGNYHNEVVVVYVRGEDTSDSKRHFQYSVNVLNYGSGKLTSPDITTVRFRDRAPVFNTDPTHSQTGVIPVDNILSVSVGDFLGDGHNEIAVTALGDGALLLYTFRYETAADGTHTLTDVYDQYWSLVGAGVRLPPGDSNFQLVGTLSSAAGDFDGDGADELAVAYAKWGKKDYWGQYAVGMFVLKYEANLKATLKNPNYVFDIGGLHTIGKPGPEDIVYDHRPRVQLVSGQFLFSPPAIPYGRRQLVLSWGDTGLKQPTKEAYHLQIKLQALALSNDLVTIQDVGPSVGFGRDVFRGFPLQLFSLAAGGFAGFHPDVKNSRPTSSLALSYWAPSGEMGSSNFFLQTLTVDSNGITPADQKKYTINLPVDSRARMPLVGYDLDGRSVYLGAPVHLAVQNAIDTNFVLQEPPKHAYWDEKTNQVVNLTRSDNNNVHLYNSTTDSLATKSTDETARETGGSIYATAGATATVGKSVGIFTAEGKVSVDVGIGGSYDYNEHVTNWNSQYGEQSFGSRAQTDRDDSLSGSLQTYDVWRYRVYGTPPGQPLNYFYEIVMPGPRVPFGGGGLSFDWYQPIHENGNVLSYPAALGPKTNPYIPVDLGPYTLPNGHTVQEPLVPAQLSFFDGTSGSTQLQYSTEVGEGNSVDYSHTMGENLDVRVAFKGKISTPAAGTEARGCGSVEFHNSNSWGKAETSAETTKTQTAITLNKASGVASYAYPFYPVVYATNDGTLKMAFSVPNPGSRGSNPAGYETYATLYGGLPDPALNLPRRFDAVQATPGTWAPNLRPNRKRMRGLFFRKPEKNDTTGTYDFLYANPLAGDKIRIEARIYNYSVAQQANNVAVQFQAIQYDAFTNSEVCSNPINAEAGKRSELVCPASARTTIGKITIPRLGPLQFTCLDGTDDPSVTGCAPPAFINWDTNGFGPSNPGTKEYRIYVVLNPSDSGGQEIYSGEAPPVAITNVTNTAPTSPMMVTAPGNHFSTKQFVIVGGVQGLNEANGIYQVGTILTNDKFELIACQPSPPCAPPPTRGRKDYGGGGTATILDPGQDNEGYGVIGITTNGSLVDSSASDDESAPQDYLRTNSLQALTQTGPGLLEDSGVQAYVGVPLQLSVIAYSSAVHADFAHVLLFDGDPAQGAPAIADRFIHPGENGPNGASVWIEWTPTTLGVHHLYAVLLEGAGAFQEVSELDVNVVPNPM